MLAQGVSLNNVLLALQNNANSSNNNNNSSNNTTNANSSNKKNNDESFVGLETGNSANNDDLINKKNSDNDSNLTDHEHQQTKLLKIQDSNQQQQQQNHQQPQPHQLTEKQQQQFEELQKLTNLLSTYQQNPDLLSTIAGFVSSSSSSSAPNSSPFTALAAAAAASLSTINSSTSSSSSNINTENFLNNLLTNSYFNSLINTQNHQFYKHHDNNDILMTNQEKNHQQQEQQHEHSDEKSVKIQTESIDINNNINSEDIDRNTGDGDDLNRSINNKDTYRTKIKSHHHHHHQRINPTSKHRRANDRERIDSLKLNTSISSSLTSNSSCLLSSSAGTSDAPVGVSSSSGEGCPVESCSSSSPSLVSSSSLSSSSSSVASSANSSPSLSPQPHIVLDSPNHESSSSPHKMVSPHENKSVKNNLIDYDFGSKNNSSNNLAYNTATLLAANDSQLNMNHRFSNSKNNENKYQLAQSLSVPKLSIVMHPQDPLSTMVSAPTTPTNVKIKKGVGTGGGGGLPNSSYDSSFVFGSNLNSASSATYVPPTNNNGVSNEVKQKLKNVILQKLDKNKGLGAQTLSTSSLINSSNSHLNDTSNRISQNNYMIESTNHHLNQKSNKNNLNSTNSISTMNNGSLFNINYQQMMNPFLNLNHQHQQQHFHKQQLSSQLQFPPNPHLLNVFNEKQKNENGMNHLTNQMLQNNENLTMNNNLELLNEMDENSLRRTTSEPNLKVKSALKDRLLEKRNLLNPFVMMRRQQPQQQQQQQQQQQPHNTNKQQTPQIPLINKSQPVKIVKQNLSPSNSLSKLPNSLTSSGFTEFSNHQQQQIHQQHLAPNLSSITGSLGSLPLNLQSNKQHHSQDSILAAAAAAAAAAVAAVNAQSGGAGQSDQTNQSQTALNALLNLANNKSNPLSNNLAATLHHLVLQQQQQQQQQQFVNNSDNRRSSNIYDQIALANAFANQVSQYRDNHHSNESNHVNHQAIKDKIQCSLSFPILPSAANTSTYNKLNSNFKQNPQQNSKQESVTIAPKFGHIAHVEEENEIILANELKQAADVNKSLMYEYQHGNQMNVDDEEENNECTPIEYTNSKMSRLSHGNIGRLERASSHFNYRNHSNLYNYHRLNHSSYGLPSHSYGQNNQRHHYQSPQSHLTSIDKAQQQLALLQQQESEERKLQQEFANRASYFSDPYLLKSFEIASISSTNNLNYKNHPSTNAFLAVGSQVPKLNYNNSSKRCANQMMKTTPVGSLSNLSKNTGSMTQMDCSSSSAVGSQDEDRIYRYTTGLVYDKSMLKHECTCNNPSNHLETPDRIKSIWNRIKMRDLNEECEIITPKVASITDLLNCHSEQYSLIYGSDIEMRPKLPKEYLQMYMMNVCIAPCQGFALAYDQDNSWNEEHTPIACRVAIGSTYELASLVSNGKLKNGFALVRPPGSHAESNKPLGFCYFNTVAIVAKMLKKNLLLDRILIVDWDVHHGNGTQQMTYNDPNILYISLHRHDYGNFFPGTGSIEECGQDAGLGKNVNIAWNGKLDPPMGDAEYLSAFRCVVMPIAEAFKPQIVLVSAGFDGTDNHPKELGGYKVSPMCFAYMTKKLMSLAEGKIVLALEGGYDLQSLCDCSEMCLNALLNKQIPAFPSDVVESIPNESAIKDLESVVEIQKKHWPNLNEYKKYIKMSHNQFIGNYTE